jgi:hypothetical protein
MRGRPLSLPIAASTALLAIAGCGSSGHAPTTVTVVTTAPTQTMTQPRARTSEAPTTTTTRSTRTEAPSTTTTAPRNLPTPKKHSGPRKISVSEASTPIEVANGRSAAQQLVEAWKGHAVASADHDVALVQRHLRSLDAKCTEPEAAIAGYVRHGIERYRKMRVVESPVEFSRALDSATPPGQRSNCKGILRTLLAQVEQG